jgi:pimeloyl-ACP methyl ester carboxylesterase
MREQMPRAGLTVFPCSGHNLNIEEPVAFNRALDDFFHAVELGRWGCPAS